MIKFLIVMFLVRFQPYIIISGSMVPTFDTGSVIIVDRWDKNLKKGDVASYNGMGLEYNRPSVTHRVNAGQKGGYRFKGDANPVKDKGIISQKRIIGKVIAYENFTCPYFCPVIRNGISYLVRYGPIPRCGFQYRHIMGIF